VNREQEGQELQRALQQAPYRFDFYQALRRLESVHRNKPRLGRALRTADEAVRLSQEPTMAFAPSTLAGFYTGRPGIPPRLSVFFFGMFGPNGPLPLHLTEYARSRLRTDDDPTFSRFLDIFHHRLLSLFFRAWADAQPTVSFDRPDEDRFGTYVASLFGLGLETLRDRDAMPDLTKLHFSGRLACQTKHAEGLAAIVGAYYRCPSRVVEFVGQWLLLPYANRLRLGETPNTGTLGRNAVLGARIWDAQQKFRLVMGPMDFKTFFSLLPVGESLPALVALVRNYIGNELDWDLNLILMKEEVPPVKLGEMGLLGWTTWLTTEPMERDADDLTLDPVAHVG